LLRGLLHLFNRVPQDLTITTPYVNGSIEGTELVIQVSEQGAAITVFEGTVTATNEQGSVTLTAGDQATVQAGQAPLTRTMLKPRDAVTWALYYPPIADYQSDTLSSVLEGKENEEFFTSLHAYRKGDTAQALAAVAEASEEIASPQLLTYRAGLLLSVGRVNEAQADINHALILDSRNSQARALQSIIALTQNDKDQSLRLANTAVTLNQSDPTALISRSYALQAAFDLKGAERDLTKAIQLDENNALAWARYSELKLMQGYLDEAIEAARRSAALNPQLARDQSVLGFAFLTEIRITEAKEAFSKAISLDQADPLPRLGLGLALIHEGDLEAGRQHLEIAVSLDPNNSLLRSYLGKAYFEEKKDAYSRSQFEAAKELDPLDPTAYLYDAIRKQTINRPVEALQDLQRSIELNDNRAVYRSRLLLDEDLAARSASLGRIYNVLGFQQRALVEGWKSVNTDPGSYSAHRFLADSYAALPRHEIARVSELLQSQLLQPLNITPVQPHLAESNIFIVEASGPGDASFNEFNPLFLRNRLAFQTSGVIGGDDTAGDEVVQSGVWNWFSYSLGQYHFETDGTRPNNDQDKDLYDGFVQVRVSPKTSVQAEYRYRDYENGDLLMLFDPDYFLGEYREDGIDESFRTGIRHAFGPRSDLLVSWAYVDTENDILFDSHNTFTYDEEGTMLEAQQLFYGDRAKIIGGAGYFSSDRSDCLTVHFPIFPQFSYSLPSDWDVKHTNLYFYSLLSLSDHAMITLGGSADFYDDETVDEEQLNPKIGFTWNPFPKTTLRLAVFRTLKRSLISNQTLEPTQVSGFNQFFDDANGADVWRYGVGIDQKVSDRIYVGAELSRRDLDVAFSTLDGSNQEDDVCELLSRVYCYYTPHEWFAFSLEYLYEYVKYPHAFPGNDVQRLDTQRVVAGFSFFHPGGLYLRLQPAFISQDGTFRDPFAISPDPATIVCLDDSDDFFIFDASLGYRLPKRLGTVSIEARNLTDEEFSFQDTDPLNPSVYPDSLILCRFTLAF
ncbi:MAG TPA: TonB-dependent receptor, partial [Thermodesulfobacteriota bacterium]|nr:TonB-dependent receptor [Thermodesulfobacteriota bacterium]